MYQHLNLANKSYIIEITQKCNYACSYCYNRKLRTHSELGLQDFKVIIDKISEKNKPQSMHLIGGEPFLYPHLLKIVSYLNDKEIHTSISTNGSNLDKELLKELIKNNLTHFEVSLDTYDSNIYKSLCKTEKSPSDIYQFIRFLKENNCTIRIAIIVTNNNLQTLEKTIDVCYTLLVDEIALYQYVAPNREDNSLSLSKNQLLELLVSVNFIAKKINVPVLFPIPIESCIINTKEFSNIKFGRCSCADEKWFIDANGNLKACELSNTAFGNLLETSFHAIISNPKVQLFKEDHKILACTTCPNFEYCKGGCRFTKIF